MIFYIKFYLFSIFHFYVKYFSCFLLLLISFRVKIIVWFF
nr:MAG TPA: hypothetical protein [Caudoviricetes sp.]